MRLLRSMPALHHVPRAYRADRSQLSFGVRHAHAAYARTPWKPVAYICNAAQFSDQMTYTPEQVTLKDLLVWLARALPWLAYAGYGGRIWNDVLKAKRNPVRHAEAQKAAERQYDKALRFLVVGGAVLLGYYSAVLPWVVRSLSRQS